MTFTTIVARRGLVHAAVLTGDRTLCGRKFSGWLVAATPTTCAKCLAAIERLVIER